MKRHITTWLALALVALGGCASRRVVECEDPAALWSAALRAAADHGFEIVRQDRSRGLIVGFRARAAAAEAARLEMRLYPSPGGSRIEPVIRTVSVTETPEPTPSRASLQEPRGVRSRRRTASLGWSTRRPDEEGEILRSIRERIESRRALQLPENRKGARAP